MEHKHFECESCGYLMRVERNVDEPMFCPFCRGSMQPDGANTIEGDMKTYTCGECSYAFDAPAAQNPPYKCPHCSGTYSSAPGRHAPKRM